MLPLQILPDVSTWAYNGTAELRGETAHVWLYVQRCARYLCRPNNSACIALREGYCRRVERRFRMDKLLVAILKACLDGGRCRARPDLARCMRVVCAATAPR